MSDAQRLPDEVLDGLAVRATVDRTLTVHVHAAEGGAEPPFPVRALGSVRGWDEAAVLLRAAADGGSGATDAQRFSAPRDGLVEVAAPTGDAVVVSAAAFTRFMARIGRATEAAALQAHDPIVGSATWREITGALERLAR